MTFLPLLSSRVQCRVSRLFGRWGLDLVSVLVPMLILVVPVCATPQQRITSQFTHSMWTSRAGLPVPVRAIVQTLDGYLWLGTESGLYRFDGLNFQVWEPASGDHLLGDAVSSLFVSKDGRLWIGYEAGGVGVLTEGRLQNFDAGQGVPSGGILSIVEDNEGAIWACGQYGVSRYSNGAWHSVGEEMGYSAPAGQSMLVDRNGNLWIATDGKDFRLDRDSVRRNTVLTLPRGTSRFVSTGLGVGMVWSIRESPDGDIWIADTTGNALRHIAGSRDKSKSIAVHSPTSFLFDGHRASWIGTIGSAWHSESDAFSQKATADRRIRPIDDLSGGIIYTTFQDREGNIWFGTSGGLDEFRPNKVVSLSAKESLVPSGNLGVSATSDGSLWAMAYTSDRLWRFHDPTATDVPAGSRLAVKDILTMFTEGESTVWLGGNSQLAKGINGRFSLVNIPAIAKNAYIEAVAKDRQGSLWLSLWTRQDNQHIVRFENGGWKDLTETVRLPSFRCRLMFGDKEGRMWLGFENGQIAVFDREKVRLYGAEDGLPHYAPLTITGDARGDIWVGSGGGLSRFENNRFSTITKQNGLPGNSVSGLVEDEDGSIWIAGALAILKVSREELDRAYSSPTYRMEGETFDARDGLSGLPRQREPFPTVARGANGWLWFATTEGVAAINPRLIQKNGIPPPVVIENVRSDDRLFDAASGMHFHPNTRTLEFHFTALSLSDPARVKFRYMLEGYEKTWRRPVSERMIRYTNLSPGSYTFRVTACNNDGVWNEEGARLDFRIEPAYYQTNWFRILCILLCLGAIWIVYRLRVAVLRQRQQLLEKNQELLKRHHSEISALNERLVTAQEEERSRISEELHDGVLQQLTGVCIRLGAVERPGMSESEVKQKVRELQERLIAVGTDIRQLSHGLHPPALQGVGLPGVLRAYCNEFSEIHGIRVRYDIDSGIRELPTAMALSLYRIAQEALGNVAKHSRAKNVEVHFKRFDGGVLLRIDDDGIGFTLSKKAKSGGLGVINMRERVRLLGGSIDLGSQINRGAYVLVKIPYHGPGCIPSQI